MLTSLRFNMQATILRTAAPGTTEIPSSGTGYTKYIQDPDTGQIKEVWVPVDQPDDPETPQDESVLVMPCIVRPVVDGGIRVAGTTERIGALYENVDFVIMSFPREIILTKRDRVTDIRDRSGQILWVDEEFEGNPTRSTVFNVNGVSPQLDAFNRHIENRALLERAE